MTEPFFTAFIFSLCDNMDFAHLSLATSPLIILFISITLTVQQSFSFLSFCLSLTSCFAAVQVLGFASRPCVCEAVFLAEKATCFSCHNSFGKGLCASLVQYARYAEDLLV